MRSYIFRRLLLIPITLLGITMLVFGMTRILPGGPAEQALQHLQSGEGRAGRFGGNKGGLSEEQLEMNRMQFSMNDEWFTGYLCWLGILQREINPRSVQFPEGTDEAMVLLRYQAKDGRAYSKPAWVERSGDTVALVFRDKDGNKTPVPKEEGWHVRFGLNQKESGGEFEPDKSRVIVHELGRTGLLLGDLGDSLHMGDPVIKMIKERMPISIWFGLITLFLTYAICIPLGVVKAIKHRTWVDSGTSVLLFIGYAMPGFVLGSLLLMFFAFQNQWFPASGFHSEGFAAMSLWGKFKDILHHTVLPLICYVVPSFALTTMMMKNNLMDSLAADYVRTAVAKGAPFRKAVVRHAVRNAIIPICATLGQAITVLVSGSFLIENVFDINGFGYMAFHAAVHRDYPIVMGVLTISAFLLLIGDILSDIILALVNPRIRFE